MSIHQKNSFVEVVERSETSYDN